MHPTPKTGLLELAREDVGVLLHLGAVHISNAQEGAIVGDGSPQPRPASLTIARLNGKNALGLDALRPAGVAVRGWSAAPV
jgi:hypothetical protein